MRRTPRRPRPGDVNRFEWDWLVAKKWNPFFALDVDADRMLALWREHEAEIRALWARDGEPMKLPHGHPAADGPDVPA